MSAGYTFDVFSSLDGYGSHNGDWGKQGPELLAHRLASYDAEQRMVFGAATYRDFVEMLAASGEEPEVLDPWVTRMRSMPATVVSSTLAEPLAWPGLVDRIQVTIFPVLTGATGLRPIFEDAADFDLELIEARTFDGHTQELTYRPTLH